MLLFIGYILLAIVVYYVMTFLLVCATPGTDIGFSPLEIVFLALNLCRFAVPIWFIWCAFDSLF